MKTITQILRFRQSVVKYALAHGVTSAAMKYNKSRQSIYRWKNRYDGTLVSLSDRSRRPKSHPNQHTESEIKLILDMWRRNRDTGLVVFWVKLKLRGYTRTVSALYRILRRHDCVRIKRPNPKYKAKAYEQMQYPGQRVQIDVKRVPRACLAGSAAEKKFYQYTAIDEYSRYRFLAAFDEASTYTSELFLEMLVRKFPFRIESVQTDNGPEFTNRFTSNKGKKTLFEEKLQTLKIEHKLIRPYTPRHNGKVERSHRKDNEYFYARHTFYSLEDFAAQLKTHNRKYNDFPMRPLEWKSPKQTLKDYHPIAVTHV